MNINETLKEREATYGAFKDHSRISQSIKDAMHDGNGKWYDLSTDKKEALEMIAHKIARILNGDPDYADNWHDIAGYATLIEKSAIEKNQKWAHLAGEQ